jgi:hypothetical protein
LSHEPAAPNIFLASYLCVNKKRRNKKLKVSKQKWKIPQKQFFFTSCQKQQTFRFIHLVIRFTLEENQLTREASQKVLAIAIQISLLISAVVCVIYLISFSWSFQWRSEICNSMRKNEQKKNNQFSCSELIKQWKKKIKKNEGRWELNDG